MIEYGGLIRHLWKTEKKRYIIEKVKNNLSIYRFAGVRKKMLKLIYLNACHYIIAFLIISDKNVEKLTVF